ncbi:MAG: hypothetical protein ACO3OZ_16190 [bacterium]
MQSKTLYLLTVLYMAAAIMSFVAGRLTAETGPDFVEVCTDQERILVETEGGYTYKYISGACLEWTVIDIHSAEVADVTTYTRIN